MYATVDNLKDRLKDTYNELYYDGAAVDDDLATDDLTAVSAEIDGALGNRYSVPVTAAGALPLLKSWCLTLCEELAWCRGDAVEVPEAVSKRCEKVRDLLMLYAKGDRFLSGATELSNAANTALVDGPDPVLTRDDLAGW